MLSDRIAKDVANTSGKWPDSLPVTDYDHLQRTQPKLLGYSVWQRGCNLDRNDHVQKCKNVQEAYEVTQKCLDSVRDEGGDLLNIHNNLLYYCIGFNFHAERLPEGHQIKKQHLDIKRHVEYIEKSISQGVGLEIETLDTLYKAYYFLGNTEKAGELADSLIDLCLQPAAPAPSSEVRLDLIRNANSSKNSMVIESFD